MRGHDDLDHRALAACQRRFHVAFEQRGERLLGPSIPDAEARAPSRGRGRRSTGSTSAARPRACRRCQRSAMRSAGGTKSGEPSLVTFATNSMMAFFAGPSFHEGSGSAARGNRRGQMQRYDCSKAIVYDRSACLDSHRAYSGRRDPLSDGRRSESMASIGRTTLTATSCQLFCSVSSAWSMPKLAGFCRGGNSLNVSMNFVT